MQRLVHLWRDLAARESSVGVRARASLLLALLLAATGFLLLVL